MIHVCFGLHDAEGRYSKFTGTTITSIFENTRSEVTAHILHDETLTDDNRKKFLQLAARYNQRVEFYNVEEICPDGIKFLRDKLAEKIQPRLSIGMFYRLFAKKILSKTTDRIIYLDSDTIVNFDIAELWQIDLKNFPLAAVPEISIGLETYKVPACRKGIIPVENYFNSGVVMFDPNYFTEKFLADGVQFLLDNPECYSLDQDILNFSFSKHYLKLEPKFNSCVAVERHDKKPVSKKIYHYMGRAVGLDMKEDFQRLWMDYFLRTPWCDVQAVGHLCEEFDNYDAEIKTLLMKLSAALIGKKRAFITFAAYIDAIKKFFDANDKELIVIETFIDFNELIRAIKKLRKNYVFFSMVENFTIMRNIFSDIGLVENKDYFNGMNFLAKSHGCRVSSYRFVKAM